MIPISCRRSLQFLSLGAALWGFSNARAAIFLTATEVPLQGNTLYGTLLNNNGWVSYIVTAHADATSMTVQGFDFSTPAGVGGNSPGNIGYTGKNWGIFGTFQQDWVPASKKGPAIPPGVHPGQLAQ